MHNIQAFVYVSTFKYKRVLTVKEARLVSVSHTLVTTLASPARRAAVDTLPSHDITRLVVTTLVALARTALSEEIGVTTWKMIY